MKVKLIVAALSVMAMNAHADDARVEKRIRATGGVQNVMGTVGSCTLPIPYGIGSTSATVSSNFAYVVCREYESYEATVTGSSWNTSESKIESSVQRLYKLETAQAGDSRFLMGQSVRTKDGRVYTRAIPQVEYILAMTGVASNCAQSRQLVESTSMPIQQTRCSGQSPVLQ